MKKFLIILLALIIGGVGGYFAYKKFFSGNSSFSSNNNQVTAANYNEPFMWGTTMRPDAFGRYIDELWLKQIKVANNLGAPWVRIPWSYAADDQFKFNDEVMNYLINNGLEIYLVVEPNGDFEKVQDPYKDGYDNAYRIASHYKGKIKYYQIMNEAGSNAIIDGTYSGENESDYDATKYQRTRDWIKGALEGVKKADPEAYRAVTNQWLQTGFLEKLKKDNVDYDMIGWDWFSDMGFIGDKKLADGTLLIDKLKSFNKPFFLAEINYRPEGKNGQKGQPEEKQAAYIEKTADWAVENKLVGFYVLELFNTVNPSRGYNDYYGIYSIKKSTGGSYVPDEPLKAYTVYQEIIAKYNQ